jgi:hypothetical protein
MIMTNPSGLLRWAAISAVAPHLTRRLAGGHDRRRHANRHH